MSIFSVNKWNRFQDTSRLQKKLVWLTSRLQKKLVWLTSRLQKKLVWLSCGGGCTRCVCSPRPSSVLPHTLDIKNGLLFTDGVASLQLHRRDAALSRPRFHSWPLLRSTLFIGYSPLYRTYGWRTSYAPLVDPSRWRVPVLVSNFSQDTVMVEPVSAIQSVTENTNQPPCSIELLPMHLRDLLDQTTCNNVNWQASYFAMQICSPYRDQHWPVTPTRWNTWSIREMGHLFDVHPTRCHLRRWRKRKSVLRRCWRKKMGAAGSVSTIEGSMMRLSRTLIPCPELTILWICWPVNSGSLPWTWRAVIGWFRCHRKLVSRLRSRRILGCFSSRSCRSDCATRRPHSSD